MTGENDATLAVVVSRLEDLRADVSQLRGDIAESRLAAVTRGEWEQRNNLVDTRFHTTGREIGELRTELRSRRAPAWSIAATAIAALALAWTILGPTIIAL